MDIKPSIKMGIPRNAGIHEVKDWLDDTKLIRADQTMRKPP
tara:strand:+ start:252 stop:374 length:123 start_codon:yes stop_codon:yes gene_type:complete